MNPGKCSTYLFNSIFNNKLNTKRRNSFFIKTFYGRKLWFTEFVCKVLHNSSMKSYQKVSTNQVLDCMHLKQSYKIFHKHVFYVD